MIDIQLKASMSKPQENVFLPTGSQREGREEEMRWFAMRVTYRRNKAARALLEREGIAYFVPMRYELVHVRGKCKRELVPVIQSLLFVHASAPEIQSVKSKVEFLQYIVNTRTREKIIVPEEQMCRFIAVAGSLDDQLVWLEPSELNLSRGTKVRVTGGNFEGYEGVFMKVKGARDRRVVIAIQGVIAVAMATLPPELIEPLPPEGDK